MKLTHLISITGLFVLGATEALRNDTNIKRETPECRWHRRSLNARGDEDDEDDFCFGLQPADDALWHAAECNGVKMLFGTTQNAPEAARFVIPINSPWNGEMRNELATWGWNDWVADPDTECNADFLKTVLQNLGTTTGSHLYGGPNYCFSVKHCDSDAIERDEHGNLPPKNDQYYDVNGRLYRATAGFVTAFVNPDIGALFFLRRGSPAFEARNLWGLEDQHTVPLDELPALRMSSDLAWAFWRRASGDRLWNIKLIGSLTVVNSETEKIIDRAMKRTALDEVPVWPGVDYLYNTDSYLAILGSPNGRAVGYFLAQHKSQLGGNRWVRVIRVFRANAGSSAPHIFFYIGPAPYPPPQVPDDPLDVLIPPPAQAVEVAKRSSSEKNI
ncbi:hypothetical protein J4E91_005165, partial [Alternaria rosae]